MVENTEQELTAISLKTALYRIDTNKEEPEVINNTNQLGALDNYVKDLRTEIINSPRRKAFKFSSNTTELNNCIRLMFSDQFDEGALNLANRLLRTEKQAIEEYSNLKFGIQKGGLVISFQPENDCIYVIIAKTDFMDFIDGSNFDERQGLPIKKKIFKAFYGKFSLDTHEEQGLFVFDSTNEIAKYWWEKFLELIEVHSSEHNTRNIIKGLDTEVFNRIKKVSSGDHVIMRNTSIGYFRNNDRFDISHYCQTVIDNYQPIHPDKVDMDNIKEWVRQVPEKYKCDSQFPIDRNSIRARITTTKISLTDKINLELLDSVDNLNNIISSAENGNGEKGIFIKTEKGYKDFAPDNS